MLSANCDSRTGATRMPSNWRSFEGTSDRSSKPHGERSVSLATELINKRCKHWQPQHAQAARGTVNGCLSLWRWTSDSFMQALCLARRACDLQLQLTRRWRQLNAESRAPAVHRSAPFMTSSVQRSDRIWSRVSRNTDLGQELPASLWASWSWPQSLTWIPCPCGLPATCPVAYSKYSTIHATLLERTQTAVASPIQKPTMHKVQCKWRRMCAPTSRSPCHWASRYLPVAISVIKVFRYPQLGIARYFL